MEITSGTAEVGLGWLDGSARAGGPEGLADVLDAYLGATTGDLPGSGFYGRAMGFDGGRARVEWDGRGGAAGTVRAEVKQAALDGLGLHGAGALVDSLVAAGYRPSRADLWLDDPQRRITPARVREAVLGGQAVTHARPGRFWRDDLDGRETYYLGRPGSDRMVRCYDKLEPSRTRLELQARRGAAAYAALSLATASDEQRSEVVMAQVISFVDFRERKAKGDRSRAPRLTWWQDLVGDTGRAAPAPARPRLTLEQLAAYIEFAWSKSIAEVVETMGPEWLDGVVSEGFRRLYAERSEEVAA